MKTPILLLCLSMVLFAAAAAPKSVDVTRKVAAAVRGGKLSLQVTSANLVPVEADPPKLRITYQWTNRVRTRTWQEGQTASIVVPAGQTLAITKAEYGAFDDAVDVTPAVAALVKNNAIAPTTVDDQSMGVDSGHGVTKQLIVRYVVGGKQKMLSVEQGEELKIPAPAHDRSLIILEATYGVPVNVFDVTDIVADQVQGNTLTLTPSDELFGDPAPMLAGKQLQVTCLQAGESRTVSAEAGKPLKISPKNSTPLVILKATYGVVEN